MFSSILIATLIVASAPATDPQPEFVSFAQKIEAGLSAGKVDALSLDDKELLRRSLKGVDTKESGVRETFQAVFERSKFAVNFSNELVRLKQAGGRYTLLNVRREGREHRALIRALSNGGVNYFDLVLVKRSADAIVVADCFAYISAEYLSESARRLMLMAVAESKMGILDRLKGKERALAQGAASLIALKAAVDAGDNAKALELFEELPASLKKEKTLLLLRMRAAFASGDEAAYARAIDDIAKAAPGDAALALVMIDGYFMRKKFAEAAALVDQLHARVNDPFLHYLRGSIQLEAADLTKANESFERAMKEEPSLPEGYWGAITVALQLKEFAKTAELLTAVEKNASMVLGDLAAVPLYAEFVRSPEYRKWSKNRKATAPVADAPSP